MKLSDYDYKLEDSLIAKHPPKKRGESRLLVLDRRNSKIKDDYYYNLDKYLNPGDLIILNNTKVLPARIKVYDQNKKLKEILILERHHKNEDWFKHNVLYKGRLKANDKLITKHKDEIVVEEILGNGTARVISKTNLLELSNKIGEVPLPPYLKRKSNKEDIDRYQTLWAKEVGSVAAPTASLNMTKDLIKRLKLKGIKIAYSTLHVGIGTFLPIRVDNLKDHKMHKEYFEIPLSTIEAIKNTKLNNKRVVAVGTTVTRALEYCGKELLGKESKDIYGEADIFIYPGYEFKIVDVLLTNFHAPKTTVLMLASAFSGWDNLYKAYNHATNKKYQFLSYGDSMLII